MKKGQYILYVLLFILTMGAVLMLAGNSLLPYIDLLSLLIILVFLLLLTIFQTGFRQTVIYYKAVFDPDTDAETAEGGSRYFSSLSLYTLAAGTFGFLMGIIAILAFHMEDTKNIGPNLAVALITLFYAVILCLLIFLPFKMALDGRIKRSE